MGRGRPRKPTELHDLHGTRRPHRHGRAENDVVVAGAVGPDDPPAWMTDSQEAGWRYAVENAPLSVLKRIDRAVLTAYVCAEDRFVVAQRKLNEIDKTSPLPLLTRGRMKGEVVVSPYVRISNHAMLIMVRLAAELGFTPASRPRLNRGDGELPANPLVPPKGTSRRRDDFGTFLASRPDPLARPN